MALPISNIPILTGVAAASFVKNAKAVEESRGRCVQPVGPACVLRGERVQVYVLFGVAGMRVPQNRIGCKTAYPHDVF